MKANSSFAKLVFALALTAIIIGFSALSQQPNADKDSFRKKQSRADVDTGKSGKLNRNGSTENIDRLDIEIKHLDIEMQKLDDKLKNLDIKINKKEIDNALKNIDVDKINAQINETIKKIDLTEISKKINESISRVEKVQMKEVQKQLEKVKIELENIKK